MIALDLRPAPSVADPGWKGGQEGPGPGEVIGNNGRIIDVHVEGSDTGGRERPRSVVHEVKDCVVGAYAGFCCQRRGPHAHNLGGAKLTMV